MNELTDSQWRRLQALSDLSQAFSALTFFMEIPEKTSFVERRRFRCYHDSAIISYCRPFVKSRGRPTLSLKSICSDISSDDRALHDNIILNRNKVIAHSDEERTRLLLTSFDIDGFNVPQLVEDEGFLLLGKEFKLEILLRKLKHSLQHELVELVQRHPPGTRFLKDFLYNLEDYHKVEKPTAV